MGYTEQNGLHNFYKDRTIFITGASGFMGKVLVEKLLFSCSSLKKVYILLRTKRGVTPKKRLERMLSLPLFDRLRNFGDFGKLEVVEGDINKHQLGLSDSDVARLIEEVSVVFHCAATLKLESNLRDAVEMNICGTDRALALARRMKKLEVFVHVSTAFCHVDQEVVYEEPYPTKTSPQFIMSLIQNVEDSVLDKWTPDLIHPHPNTYTFSKRMAEVLVVEQSQFLPVCIARPSIVCPALTEPVPGWVDNLNGPIGILVAAGKGVLRSMYCKKEYKAELIPVDFAINGLLAMARKVAREWPNCRRIQVFNITQSQEKTVSWGEILEMGKKFIFEVPFDIIFWFPDGNIRSSLRAHKIHAFFLHWIPAYFVDSLLFILCRKPFLVRVQKKIAVGLEVLQYFTTHPWSFSNTNFLRLRDEMSASEKAAFPMDFKMIDDLPYLKQCILGAREYCLKEPNENLPRARRMIKGYYILDRFVRLLLVLFMTHLIISWAGTASYVFDAVGENIAYAMGRFTSQNDVQIQRHG